MAKRKSKKAVEIVSEDEEALEDLHTEDEVIAEYAPAPTPVAHEEVIEEVIEEAPEVVEERELPAAVGEETSETVMLGGRLMRVIKSADGTSYKPL